MAKVGRFVTDPRAGAYCQVTLDTVVTNQEGTQVLTGEALVMVEAPKE